MARKTFSPEQTVAKLRQVEVLMVQGQDGGSGLQRGRDFGSELLSVAQGVWGLEARSGQAIEGVGARECPTQAGGSWSPKILPPLVFHHPPPKATKRATESCKRWGTI